MAEDQGSDGGAEATDATPGTDTAAEATEADAVEAKGPPPEPTATSEDDGEPKDEAESKEEPEGEAKDEAEPKGETVEAKGEESASADDTATAEGGAEVDGGLDLEVERGRLDEVEKQIEEGRRALADLEEDVEPESDGPPVAKGEGAANAPPG